MITTRQATSNTHHSSNCCRSTGKKIRSIFQRKHFNPFDPLVVWNHWPSYSVWPSVSSIWSSAMFKRLRKDMSRQATQENDDIFMTSTWTTAWWRWQGRRRQRERWRVLTGSQQSPLLRRPERHVHVTSKGRSSDFFHQTLDRSLATLVTNSLSHCRLVYLSLIIVYLCP